MQVLAVPVKSLERTKTRLAPILTPAERADLSLAMFEDVLDACVGQEGWETWVVSPADRVLDRAVREGARAIPEEVHTLLGAVGQVERAASGRASALAVVLADLPFITRGSLSAALSSDPDNPVVAVPAASDRGTNMLLRRPPTVIPARFGRSSFHRHRLEAYRAGVTLREVRSPELGFDLDRPADLATVLSEGPANRTRAVCLELGVADRLHART